MKIIFTKKKLLLIIAGILVVALLVIIYAKVSPTKNIDQQEVGSSKTYDPPTEEEKAQADAHKDDLVTRMEEEDQPSESKKVVTPVITNAAQNGDTIRVTGFVSDIFENNGTCTATFTQGGTTLVKTGKALANVSTTDCVPFSVARSEFSLTGEWQVTLAYKSSTAEGVSPAKALTIQ